MQGVLFDKKYFCFPLLPYYERKQPVYNDFGKIMARCHNGNKGVPRCFVNALIYGVSFIWKNLLLLQYYEGKHPVYDVLAKKIYTIWK